MVDILGLNVYHVTNYVINVVTLRLYTPPYIRGVIDLRDRKFNYVVRVTWL